MGEIRLLGAIVNAIAIAGGSLIGLLLKRLIGDASSSEKGKAISDHIYFGMALCVLAIGMSGAIESADILVVIASMAIGSVIGHLLRLENGIDFLGERVQLLARNRFGNVADGFVSATLLFCVGSMAIVGALDSGLSGDHTIQYTKATLDGVISVILASSMGIGVMLSGISVFLLQGSITLLAQWISPFLTADVVSAVSVVGSILIVGLSLNMLKVTKLKIMNYMPATFLPILLMPLFELFPFQNSGARETVISGLLEGQYPIEHIDGLPYKTIK